MVTAGPSFLMTKVIGKHLESLTIMGISLVVGGVVMWIVDAWSVGDHVRTRDMDEMSLGQAVWIGACQILSAVFPGTSRSMATITSAQLAGHVARLGARVLLLSLDADDGRGDRVRPAEVAARLRGQPDRRRAHRPPRLGRARASGFVVSFLVAYVSVAWFMAWVRRRSFAPFAVYRIVIGLLVLLFAAKLAG